MSKEQRPVALSAEVFPPFRLGVGERVPPTLSPSS